MPITLKDIEQFDNGAQFLNADLHVHSFGASHDVNDSKMTVEAIIDAAIGLGIRLLAITDHNNDANTERSIEYATRYTGNILVIPGIEITTANGHILVYFAPSQAANVRNLLGRINLVGKLGDQDSHTTMSMADVINEAERSGGICVGAHIDRQKSGFEMLADGYPNWKKDILYSPGLYALEFDNPANLIWYADEDEPTSHGAERKKLVKGRVNVPGLLGRPYLAHIQGSDAHSIKDFTTSRVGKILTRFKLTELTYEAFRTALTDPEARVRAVATIPRSLPRVLGMQMTGGFLDGETYHFSDNLNCFIGGRGTGKSTALQGLAYGLDINDEIEDNDNCPGTVVTYCEDANGIQYRYERIRGSKPIVKAREEREISDVPVDAFRVEYFRQGELAEVAKNPLKNPTLLQQFLDRHLLLTDLLSREALLINALEQNSAQIIPLEGSVGQLKTKKAALDSINKKLAIAEEGKLKDIAAEQGRLSNEKNLAISLGQIRDGYKSGLTMSNFLRDYAQYEEATKPLTNMPACNAALHKIRNAIAGVNTFLNEKEKEIEKRFLAAAKEISDALEELKQAHTQLEAQLNIKTTDLQKKGLSGNIVELQTLLKQKGTLTQEINKINAQIPQLNQLREDRQRDLSDLENLRKEIMARRKDQLNSINRNLATTIQDYTVFVHYEERGIIDEFMRFILERMQGTYFQENTAEQFCSKITPSELAELVLNENCDEISRTGGIDKGWAAKICEKLRFYSSLHALEVMWKAPCPIISVLTKGAKPKNIPVNQLSDGQKHTIMLTIAMLSESNIPLVIDQPEDDLDNAFIFSAVVKALRSIKEHRQVILVTHNANIAVLGDAELLLPMRRSGDRGTAFDRGSIDKAETKNTAVNILEGGDAAFRRRQEIYGY